MSRVPITDEFRAEVQVPVSAEKSSMRPWGQGIGHAAASREDVFAPYLGPRVCLSRSGRWRGRHTWVGDTCVLCDRRKGGVAAE
jgi:hypothetical protein